MSAPIPGHSSEAVDFVVMYHFVHPERNLRWPVHGAISLDAFKAQIESLRKFGNIVSPAVFFSNFEDKLNRKSNILLSFDDGLRDHWEFVAPILVDQSLPALFSVPSTPIVQKEGLEVQKLQFLVRDARGWGLLRREAQALSQQYLQPERLSGLRRECSLSKTNTPEVAYVKRIFQRELPPAVRSVAVSKLFNKVFATSEEQFVDEVYLDSTRLKDLVSAGFDLGGHGDKHVFLGHSPNHTQVHEISKSRQLLADYAPNQTLRTFCYPYGSFNAFSQRLMRQEGFDFAFKDGGGIVRSPIDRYEVPRIDTIYVNQLLENLERS